MSAAYAILIQAASSTRLCGLLSRMFMTELGFPGSRKPCRMMDATLTLNLWTGYVVGRLSLVTTLIQSLRVYRFALSLNAFADFTVTLVRSLERESSTTVAEHGV